ncbi:MAG: hypothetical protein LDL41_26070 [Coleofasciculus sp. S288]|nr:hypothetical protein [Coleofasciculus sp. S288]
MIGFVLKLIFRPLIALLLGLLAPLIAQLSPIIGICIGLLSVALAFWFIADAIEKLAHVFSFA